MGLFLQNNLNGILYHYHISNEPSSLSLKKKKKNFNYFPIVLSPPNPKAPSNWDGLTDLKIKIREEKEVMRNVLVTSRTPRFHFSGTTILGVGGNNRNDHHTPKRYYHRQCQGIAGRGYMGKGKLRMTISNCHQMKEHLSAVSKARRSVSKEIIINLNMF